ncbi:MAG: endonuclease/exonuclease/phosphatase family protein [Akkermansiaceae bacterium]
MVSSKPLIYKHTASIFIGAFLSLCFSACDREKQTPTWEPSAKRNESHVKQSSSSSNFKHTSISEDEDIRFLSYNLKNYLTEDTRTKKNSEITALIQIISEAKPDILGVCEIGTHDDISDLQLRLQKQGILLPHTHLTRGSDDIRSLAILSRFPIVEINTAKKLHFLLNGLKIPMNRGILDATIKLPKSKVRFLGVHLKSKQPSAIANQELVRRNESLLLRTHIDAILTIDPSTPLIVYGDMNDTRRSQTIDSIRGRTKSPLSMHIVELADSRGENWTHFWDAEDIYSRLDYVFISPTLKPRIKRQESSILDPQNWAQASDHRPLLLVFR